eukprot:5323885-Alexandrium_andersonii.AAC.1
MEIRSGFSMTIHFALAFLASSVHVPLSLRPELFRDVACAWVCARIAPKEAASNAQHYCGLHV